jgi:uroporphyrinogen decarboxylase
VQKYGFEGICRNAELCAQCTVMPVTDLGVDAAIHMSDLLIPVEAMGFSVRHTLEGPRIENPVRTREDIERLIIPEPQEGMGIWLQALALAKKELAGKAPLIGWAGGPLSTAAFLIEGGPPGGPVPYQTLKSMMYSSPALLHELLDIVTDMYIPFTCAQVDAGAEVMMLFDLNVPAALSPRDYDAFCLPWLEKLLNAIREKHVPIVYAADGSSFLNAGVGELGVDVVALDHTVDLDDAVSRLGSRQAVQGNLDPFCLFAPEKMMEQRVKEIIASGRKARSHIFSLGGWVQMNTPFEKVKFLVDLVHSL